MNCFEWQSRASDYLDGTLMSALKQDADAHLESCAECQERHQRYRTILQTISALPRAGLPVPIRTEPLTAELPNLDTSRITRSRWERIPWYLRTTIEASAIVLLILTGISAGPRLRALYDRGIERNLAEFAQAFSDIVSSEPAGTAPPAAAIPLGRGKLAANTSAEETAGDEFVSEDSADEESGDTEEAASEAVADPAGRNAASADTGSEDAESDVRVGSSEIWRFILKTDSPHEFRTRIVGILSGLRVPQNTAGLGGVEAPGGIQFDILVSKGIVPSLKKQLQGIAPPKPDGLANSPAGDTFTWFKNKSKRKIPEGKARVVIWLSQM